MSTNVHIRAFEAAEDLEDVLENLIPLKEGAKILDRHVATLYRACLKGSGPGRRKLRFVMRGREACTTRAWIAEYLEGLTQDRLVGPGEPASPRTPAARRKAVDRADRELADLGI
jgi:hypothetical protein